MSNKLLTKTQILALARTLIELESADDALRRAFGRYPQEDNSLLELLKIKQSLEALIANINERLKG